MNTPNSSPSPFPEALQELVSRQDLSETQVQTLMRSLMQGEASDAEMAAFLTALRMKGEALPEIVGTARVMNEFSTKLPTRKSGLLDTCGTGGDQLHTFNISTATALVAAACGIPVAKHGNRSVSSSSGSADVLEKLGVNVQLGAPQVAACLDQIGIGFCFAPVFHPAMKNVGPVRRQLKFRTIFNLVGPLTNPAQADYQLLGVNHPEIGRLLAEASRALGRKHAFIVSGGAGLDEGSLWGETILFQVRGGAEIQEHRINAGHFGLAECSPSDLKVNSAEESAQRIREIFDGKNGPGRDIVLANVALALAAVERIPLTDLKSGVHRAAEALDRGAARGKLEELVIFCRNCGET